MDDGDLRAALGAVLRRSWGRPVQVTGLSRLAGGASRETWAFDATAEGADVPVPLVLRRDRPDDADAAGMAREAAAFRAAAAAGVPVPRLHAEGDGTAADPTAPDPTGDRAVVAPQVGTPFLIVDRLDGETIPRRLLRDGRWAGVRPRLARELGRVLARIHAIPPGDVLAPGTGDHLGTGDRLDALRARHDRFGEPNPARELVFRWLERHRPPVAQRRLVHGDFRTGNLLVGAGPDGVDGVLGVLDWELVHHGDPMEDLGWLCAKTWRFGSAQPVGGFGPYQELFDGYAEVAGAAPDPDVVRWWEVFAAVHWSVICRMQAQRHLSGTETTVEMAVLGRRAAESEHDALLALGLTSPSATTDLLDGAAPAAGAGLHGRPTVDELLEAVSGFLTDELPGALDDARLRFSARVAANALAIARRELRAGAAQDLAHRERLAGLGVADDAALAAAIRSGAMDDRVDVVAAVRADVAARLRVANPRHTGRPG